MSTDEDAQKINTAMQDPVPHVHPPSDNVVQLFRGLYDKDTDAWYDVATVRELTGEDEEELSRLQVKKGTTLFEYMTKVLQLGIDSIGPYSPREHPQIVDLLILPDRDLVFLGLIRATYGSGREVGTRCPKCSGLNDVEINLDDDIPIIYPDFDVKRPLEVKLSKGQTVHVRIPNGEDTMESQKDTNTDAEVTTKLISRLVTFPDGNEPPDRLAWSKALSLSDRRSIAKTLVSVEIGPKMEEVDTQCAHCGAEMPIALDWVSLLLG